MNSQTFKRKMLEFTSQFFYTLTHAYRRTLYRQTTNINKYLYFYTRSIYKNYNRSYLINFRIIIRRTFLKSAFYRNIT